jgi:hypothetical protein
VTDVVWKNTSGRVVELGDLSIVNIVGVAKKPLIVTVHRNQTIIKSLRFLLKRKRKTLSILS